MIPDALRAPATGARHPAIAPPTVGALPRPRRMRSHRMAVLPLTARTAALQPAPGARAEITHMTPTPPRPDDKRTSGNPATQAQINLTVKQQREQKRQEKLAEYQKQLAKRRRSKLVWWVVGIDRRRRRHRG